MSMNEVFEGKTAVVTAGASGMGREICVQLLAAGANVIAADIDIDALSDLSFSTRGLPGKFLSQKCDISAAIDVSNLAELAEDRFGSVDFLFNHAGISAAGQFEVIPVDIWQRLIDVNLLGTVRMMDAFLPGMIDRGSGHIINTASTLALFLDSPWHAPYLATKAAVVALSRSSHLQFAGSGIKVSVFCPDYTATNFYRSSTLHGITLDEFRQKVAPSVAQEAPQVIGQLLSQLDGGAFLISMASDTVERMHATVDALVG